MSAELPVIGACLPVEALTDYRDWIFEADRDLELQSFNSAEVLTGDWQSVAQEARRRLDGHAGRLGSTAPSGASRSIRWTPRSGASSKSG